MQRVGSNRNPAVDKFGAGKNGFTAGDPQTGVQATTPGAEFFDAMQEEIARVIEGAGIALDPTKYDQLLTAIQTMQRGKATVNVAGGAQVVLTDAQYGMPILILTGALTANINLVFPAISGAWIVRNQTTGAFVVTCKTAAGTGVVVSQGCSNALFGDGTNIYAEQTDWAIIQKQTATAFTSAGAAPVFTLTPVPAITAYAANQRFRCKFHAAGTTGSNTLNVSGLGAKNLKQYDSTGAKVAAVVAVNQLADVEYDGTDFVIRDPLPVFEMPAGLLLDWIGLTPPPWAVVRDGAALNRGSYTALYLALCPKRTGTLTSGQNTVTGLSSTLDMWVGMPIEMPGFAASTTVASITSTSSVTLSANSTVSGAQTMTMFPFGYGAGGSFALTFGVPDDRGLHTRAYDSGRGYERSTLVADTTNASNVLSGITNTRGMYVGMPISGAGIPGGTTIASITGATTATMSAPATATSTAVALTIVGHQVGAEGSDEIGSHRHNSIEYSDGTYGVNTLGGGTGSSNKLLNTTSSTSIINVTSYTGGPENNVRRRIYLPIITLGA